MSNELEISGLSPKDLLTIQLSLWELLAKRTAKYTAGESSSVPIETAQRLMSSIYYTLGVDYNGDAVNLYGLHNVDLDEKFEDGIKSIERKIRAGKRLWKSAILSVAKIENISLNDTLKSIGGFWRRYDYRFFAHEIPCDIDYQLYHPVEISRFGVDYINEYLRHILIENEFLQRFDSQIAIRLLESYCRDYRGLLINLYEPIATNAIGLSMIAGDIESLNISDKGLEQISAMFESLTPAMAIELLKVSAERLCSQLKIRGTEARLYTVKMAVNLYPRIEAALPGGNLGGVFLSIRQ